MFKRSAGFYVLTVDYVEQFVQLCRIKVNFLHDIRVNVFILILRWFESSLAVDCHLAMSDRAVDILD